MQRASGRDLVGSVTQLEVLLEENADPEELRRRTVELFRGAPVATDTRPKVAFQAVELGELGQLTDASRYLAHACA